MTLFAATFSRPSWMRTAVLAGSVALLGCGNPKPSEVRVAEPVTAEDICAMAAAITWKRPDGNAPDQSGLSALIDNTAWMAPPAGALKAATAIAPESCGLNLFRSDRVEFDRTARWAKALWSQDSTEIEDRVTCVLRKTATGWREVGCRFQSRDQRAAAPDVPE